MFTDQMKNVIDLNENVSEGIGIDEFLYGIRADSDKLKCYLEINDFVPYGSSSCRHYMLDISEYTGLYYITKDRFQAYINKDDLFGAIMNLPISVGGIQDVILKFTFVYESRQLGSVTYYGSAIDVFKMDPDESTFMEVSFVKKTHPKHNIILRTSIAKETNISSLFNQPVLEFDTRMFYPEYSILEKENTVLAQGDYKLVPMRFNGNIANGTIEYVIVFVYGNSAYEKISTIITLVDGSSDCSELIFDNKDIAREITNRLGLGGVYYKGKRYHVEAVDVQ